MSVQRLCVFFGCMALIISGCAGNAVPEPMLGELYSDAAQNIGAARNPVIVIPGILGSRLIDPESGQVVWGAFTYGAADADFAEGAMAVALPMARGAALSSLRDAVEPDGVLRTLRANVGPLEVTAAEPYRDILRTLAAGKYIDRDLMISERSDHELGGPIDYAGLHATCFQFDYDWRRDISENAARLDVLIREAAALAAAERGTPTAKVDVVAHSMGGMVLMYYLRYGARALPDDGSIPPATWEGARHVERAILVGTPGAGSVSAFRQLIEGTYYAPIAPEYRPGVVGTFPSVYQLMPRERHARIVDDETGAPITGLYDPRTWERMGWGLADPDQDAVLRWLLPDVPDPGERRSIALDHLAKCLARAEQLHRALDAPMNGAGAPPAGIELHIVLGDVVRTPALTRVDASGRIVRSELAPGDGTVTRASALVDERLGSSGPIEARLRTPILWDRVLFIPADHLGLTSHPMFVDHLLFELLERPRATSR